MFRDWTDGLFLRLGYPPLSLEIDGIRFRGFLRHRSFLDQLSSGNYELITRRIFHDAIQQADLFVDAGAHIGLFSLTAGRQGKPGLPIVAFEPDSYNERALRYNLRRNGCVNVRVFPAAVSASSGLEPMLISEGTISNSLIVGRTNLGKTKSRMVHTLTIDSVLRDIPIQSLLVKLDVEGAEIMALAGMADTLKRSERFAVICEINPTALQAGGRTAADLVRTLQAVSREVFFISDQEKGLLPLQEPYEAKGNLLCLRNWEIPSDWMAH
jgi:FkbM family methyltransferase